MFSTVIIHNLKSMQGRRRGGQATLCEIMIESDLLHPLNDKQRDWRTFASSINGGGVEAARAHDHISQPSGFAHSLQLNLATPLPTRPRQLRLCAQALRCQSGCPQLFTNTIRRSRPRKGLFSSLKRSQRSGLYSTCPARVPSAQQCRQRN